MTIAKTAATGTGLLPEVLTFSSSLALDRALLREDLLGSLAHLTMLSRQKIVPSKDAASIHAELVKLWGEAARGTLELPDEEDVHMAIESILTSRLGEIAGLLHTARSRNDQVALDLRLHVREQIRLSLLSLAKLIEGLASRAESERETLLPSYTHRQRAQPVSFAYYLCSYGAMFARDAETLTAMAAQLDALPLGVGAVGGTSLPIDRELTRKLLRFSRITMNGMDTVGDRDFGLDFAYACSRVLLHASRVSTDMIDFSSAEFGYLKIDGELACGSSMMPQKRNPDVFELIRGKAGRAIGNLNQLLVTVKGLPGGYNRDLQEDRQPLLETGPLLRGVVDMLDLALPRMHADRERCLAGLESDYTQATDVAEALAMTGVPFRTAYKATGMLVRKLQEQRIPLAKVTLEFAREVDPRFSEEVLLAADPRRSVERKANAGGTGPASVERQIQQLREVAVTARSSAQQLPQFDELFASLAEITL